MTKRIGKLNANIGANAVYHCVKKNDTFDKSAQDIYNLVVTTKNKQKNKEVHVYVDIDGHRNKNGGFTPDMFELQFDFLVQFLLKYVNSVTIPMGNFSNPQPLLEMPDALRIDNQPTE